MANKKKKQITINELSRNIMLSFIIIAIQMVIHFWLTDLEIKSLEDKVQQNHIELKIILKGKN